MRVLVDTNVFVKAAIDFAQEKHSDERTIIELLVEKKLEIIYTVPLLEEYSRVAKKLENKEFSSWLRYLLLSTMNPYFVDLYECQELIKRFEAKVPKEDLLHFVACVVGNADFLISMNREFLKKAENKGFSCLTPQEFLKKAINKKQ